MCGSPKVSGRRLGPFSVSGHLCLLVSLSSFLSDVVIISRMGSPGWTNYIRYTFDTDTSVVHYYAKMLVPVKNDA